MNVLQRNNVRTTGDGSTTLVLAHGFGCDQSMWRLLVPQLGTRYRIVSYDLTGSGRSDLSAYDRSKYATLQGHADDLLEILAATTDGPVILLDHSVSAIVGLLAGIAQPERFAAQIMIAASPCYLDDGAYPGGFSRADIDNLLDTLDSNYYGWSSAMAPRILGSDQPPELIEELTSSFWSTDPDIARHFARVIFLSDLRSELPRSDIPTLILQCSEDLMSPPDVGMYMELVMQRAQLRVIENVGHCPQLSAPGRCVIAIEAFLAGLAQ